MFQACAQYTEVCGNVEWLDDECSFKVLVCVYPAWSCCWQHEYAGKSSASGTRREHLAVQFEQGNSLATPTLGGYDSVSVIEE